MDILLIDRVRRIIDDEGDTGLARIFTAQERRDAAASGDLASHLAVRFAAKEAVFKALDLLPTSRADLREIEIVRQESGRVGVDLTGHAAQEASADGPATLDVSVSYDREYAVAFAIATRSES